MFTMVKLVFFLFLFPNVIKAPYSTETLWLIIIFDHDVFVFQGTLPPPYSSTVPGGANGSLSSPVSTMTSQSSTSSLAKHRQSWLDLVSQASPPAGETAVVCSVQVHTHQEETDEVDVTQVLESSSQQESLETESNEESPAMEGEEAHRVVSVVQEEEGET